MQKIPELGWQEEAGGRWPPEKKDFFLFYFGFFFSFISDFFVFIFAECRYSAKAFAEYPKNSTRQRLLCRLKFCRMAFAECDTRQRFCRVFLGLCRVPQTLGKTWVSRSNNTLFFCRNILARHLALVACQRVRWLMS